MNSLSQTEWMSRQPWRMTRAVGFAAAGGTGLAAILHGNSLLLFIDATSFLGTVGFPGVLMIGIFGISEIQDAANTLIFDATEDRLERATGLFLAAGVLFTLSGFMMMMAGMVQMLFHLEDPTRIGPAMAVTLLSPLYALAGSVMSFSSANLIAGRSRHSGALESTVGLTSIVTGVAGLSILVPPLLEFVLLMAIFRPL